MIHIFIGTPEIYQSLFNSDLSKEVSLLLYACWHMISITLVMSAIALFISSRPNFSDSAHHTAKFISCLWLFFGLVFVSVALLDSGTAMLLILPQWTLLLPVGVLGLWGSSKHRIQ